LGYFAAIVLGAVQGRTEFLPVPSSAHLIAARASVGRDGEQLGMPVDVAWHAGTLIAVVMCFRMDLTADQAGIVLMAMTVSAAIGDATVRYFLKYLARHTLSHFARRRVALAAITVVRLATGRG
jgi:undecaprenyl pyrophosphate phosphatase UppP